MKEELALLVNNKLSEATDFIKPWSAYTLPELSSRKLPDAVPGTSLSGSRSQGTEVSHWTGLFFSQTCCCNGSVL